MSELFDTSTALSASFGGEIVWRPTPAHVERAHLTAFMRQHGIADFNELMQRSTQDVAWFTDVVLKYLDIQFYQPYSQVVDLSETAIKTPPADGHKTRPRLGFIRRHKSILLSRLTAPVIDPFLSIFFSP